MAKELRVPRNKPWQEAIKKRSAIDSACVHKDKPLAIGDTVICRHGKGTLTEFICDEQPCAIQITHGDHIRVSQFANAGKGKGGGRLQRLPISFAYDGRCERSDSISQDLLHKVIDQSVTQTIVHSMNPELVRTVTYQ